MPPACRVGDKALCPADTHGKICCPHVVDGPALTGSSDVFIDGRSALRTGDSGVHKACCGSNSWNTAQGSPTVFVNGIPLVRLNDFTIHCGGIGSMIEASATVFVDDGAGATNPAAGATRSEATPPTAAEQAFTDAAVRHLERNLQERSVGRCAAYVGNAIEAGGVRLNRGLNDSPSGRSASGYGPILEDAGYEALPPDTTPAKGDVAVIQPINGHPHGHAAMYTGEDWCSDFRQRDMYPGSAYRRERPPYTIYRRRQGQ